MNIILQLSIVIIIMVAVIALVVNLNDTGMFDSIKSYGGLPKFG